MFPRFPRFIEDSGACASVDSGFPRGTGEVGGKRVIGRFIGVVGGRCCRRKGVTSGEGEGGCVGGADSRGGAGSVSCGGGGSFMGVGDIGARGDGGVG